MLNSFQINNYKEGIGDRNNIYFLLLFELCLLPYILFVSHFLGGFD